jgi:dipeptidyl aminopeptidase/acylaminoacyl peptidase
VVTVPYGSWPSPVSIEQLTSASIGLSAAQIDGGYVYWLQTHADQGGRTGLWRRALSGGPASELTPAPTNVRNRVHEYGGGEYSVRDGVVVFTEWSDGRVYRWEDGTISAVSPASEHLRYADLRVHPDRRLVLAVREDHSAGTEPVNTLVALDLDGDEGAGTVLCSGADFYATPELSAGGVLAWTEWDHPNMPWDSTTIKIATLNGTAVERAQTVAGGAEESAVQPRWLGEELIFASDRTNWWNLYAYAAGRTRPLLHTEAEFAGPQWVLGQQPYAVAGTDRLLCTVVRNGAPGVGLLDLPSGSWTEVVPAGVAAAGVSVGAGTAAAVLSYPDRPAALCLLDLTGPDPTRGDWTEVIRTSNVTLPPGSVSVAEPVSWTGEQGSVFGWFYPPTNADARAPEGTRPPLITLSHGGPTAMATSGFRLGYQFWTTRGYAILDVNYSGSTGYGRSYRNRLRHSWGTVDVTDCAQGALAMGDQGRADPARLVVKGGSAGGYTTLRALTWTSVFAAGISEYGIGNLETLATDTHKFESRYLDGLVGPYPEAREVYVDRSPIHHVDQLSAPILLLQGRDDKVVPPDQAEAMADAARAAGLPVALILFDGEGHGFRRADTIRSSLEAQLYFLGRIFGFTPADHLPSIPIDNLD